MHLIKLLLLSSTLYAHELKVTDKRLTYNLSFDKNSIELKAHDLSLSLKRKNCNSMIMDRFLNPLNEQMQRPFAPFYNDDALVVVSDRETGYESKTSLRGKLLMSLVDEVKKMKIEEELNCKK